MRKTVTHLRISRAIWLRGEPGGGEDSWLLRHSDAKMCCIGIYLEVCGVPRRRLEDVGTPAFLSETGRIPAQALWLVKDGCDSACSVKLMDYNDNSDLSETEREESIISGFGQQGITVEFTE